MATTTHNYDGAADGDGRHQTVSDGVLLEGVPDALIFTVNFPQVWLAEQVHDYGGQGG